MKKITILLAIIISINAKAQVPPVLVKDYPGRLMNIIQTDDDTSYRVATVIDSLTIRVEYPDGTLDRIVTPDLSDICPSCATSWRIRNMKLSSQRTFMKDAAFEYMLEIFATDTVGYPKQEVRVFNDVGTSILTIPNGRFDNQLNTPYIMETRTGGVSKTLVAVNTSVFDPSTGLVTFSTGLYSTEGWISNPTGVFLIRQNEDKGLGLAYPNPSNSSLDIPYNVPEQSEGTLTILTIDGKIVKEFYINSHFNTLHFDAGEFNKGSYIYTLVVDDKVIDSKSFIIQ